MCNINATAMHVRRTKGAALTGCVIHIKLEVGDINKARVLVNVHHVWVEPCEVKDILSKARQ
jgi:hypothetical protein